MFATEYGLSGDAIAALRVAAVESEESIPRVLQWLEERGAQGPIGPEEEALAINLIRGMLEQSLSRLDDLGVTRKLPGYDTLSSDGEVQDVDAAVCDRLVEHYHLKQRHILTECLERVDMHGLKTVAEISLLTALETQKEA